METPLLFLDYAGDKFLLLKISTMQNRKSKELYCPQNQPILLSPKFTIVYHLYVSFQTCVCVGVQERGKL